MRRSIKKVAAGLLATMMIGTMLTGEKYTAGAESAFSIKESKEEKTGGKSDRGFGAFGD